MGYKCSFLDNEVYGADDVSAAFSRILKSGVLPYPERETVADSLNEMTSEVVNSGVSEYGGLEVSRTDTGAKVGQGTAFFESGVAVVVDSEGATVNFREGTPVYVYFIHEPTFNSVLLKATSEVPDGDTVVLAQIDSGGNVIDRRSYTIAKMEVNTANKYHSFTIEHSKWSGVLTNILSGSQTVYKIPHNGYRYLLLMGAELGRVGYDPKEHIIDLNAEGQQVIYLNDYGNWAAIVIERDELELTITSLYESGIYDGYDHKFHLMLV